MGVGGVGELLDVQHRERGVGNGLAEEGLGVGPEGGIEFLFRAVGSHEGGLDAHLCHGDGDQVEGAAVNGGGGHDVVAAAGDVEEGEEVGRLAGGGQHGRGAAFQLTDLGGHVIVGGVLEPGVEITGGLQIEELAHVLAGGVLEGGGLDDGDLAGLAVAGGIAALHTFGFQTIVAHD